MITRDTPRPMARGVDNFKAIGVVALVAAGVGLPRDTPLCLVRG